MSSMQIDAFCPVGIGGTKGIDTTHLKLFIGGLSPSQTSKDLFDIFAEYGTIREAVTFKDQSSVSNVFESTPIYTKEGKKVTVVLASSNTKPRRAHFNVAHGVSGHKALPTVEEEAMSTNKDAVEKHEQRKGNTKSGNVGVYSDPSLYRTANIQQIAPAQLHVDEDEDSPKSCKAFWPNEDIKNDYKKLTTKVVFGKQNDENYNAANNKAWTDKDSVYGSENRDDDFYSVKSMEWTPITSKNKKTLKQRVVRTKCLKNVSMESSETEDDETVLTMASRIEMNSDYELEMVQSAKNKMKSDKEFASMFEEEEIDFGKNTQTSVQSHHTWSQYQPQFANRFYPHNSQSFVLFCVYALDNMNGCFVYTVSGNNMVYGYNYDFAAIAPTPPVHSTVNSMGHGMMSNPQSVHSVQSLHNMNCANGQFFGYTPTTNSYVYNNQSNQCFYGSMPVYGYSVQTNTNCSR